MVLQEYIFVYNIHAYTINHAIIGRISHIYIGLMVLLTRCKYKSNTAACIYIGGHLYRWWCNLCQ